MKLNPAKRRYSFMSLFLASAIMAASVSATPAHAQYEFEDDYLTTDTLDLDQLDVEGRLSPSELLKRKRDKLEQRNRDMVEKKIEDIRIKQEVALTNKLQGAFDNSLNNMNNEDKVQTVQAAPVAPVAPAPVIQPVIETRIVEVPVEVVKEQKKSRIIPMLGVSTIKGDKVDLTSNATLSIAGETLVTPQIALGLSVGYTTMNLTDVSNQFVNNGYGGYYNNGYYSAYGQGREMKYNKLTIEANSKFFFTEDSKFKPFVGAGLSFNRAGLKYENTNSYYYNGVNFGSEELNSSSVAVTAKLGAEFDISETVGINLDLSYTKGLSAGLSKSSGTVNTNPDQIRLDNISKDIEKGDVTAIAAGVIVKF